MKNTFKTMVIALTVVLSTVSICAIPASASSTDTDWSANLNYCRLKDGDSSVYVYNQSGYNATVSVYGEKFESGITKYPVSDYNGGHIQTTGVSIPAYQRREVRQYIHELNFAYAHIYFSGTKTYGVWSPDCYGTYQKAN